MKMSSLDRQEALRRRNKDLLKQLKQQREELERLSGCTQSRKRDREEPAEVLTLTRGDRGAARAALSKPTVRFADECEKQTEIQDKRSSPYLMSDDGRGTSEQFSASDHFRDSDIHQQGLDRQQDTQTTRAKSCLASKSKKQREEHRGVTFQPDEGEEVSPSDQHHLQPLLGYDWIAGVLDAEDSLIERSDEFFNDLHVFRSLYKDECVHSPQAEFIDERQSVLPPLPDRDDQEANIETHQCTFSYRINSRLFPVPVNSQECCPVCKRQKSSHPHTAAEPALIRVNIPRSTLLPPYKYKPHRRCSFDPSDSLGLPSHCLLGWSNKGQSTLPPPSILDLRSSLDKKSSNELLEDLFAPKKSSDQLSDQIPNVSCLARHKFQHFSPKRKLGNILPSALTSHQRGVLSD